MTKSEKRRPMSESERETLNSFLKAQESNFSRWIDAAKQAIVVWFAFTVFFMIVWVFLAWLARVSFGIEIGVGSKIGDSVFAGAALAIAIWSIVESVKWVKSHKDRRPEFLADLDGGEVNEITHQFTAVKVFQEQEHGGLFYFLKTIEDRVFVLYDDESQDLGVQGENPMESEFRPKTILHMAQAPRTKFVLSREFSGDPLTVGETHDLLVSPESWPESDSFCRTRWDNLEKRFSQPRKKN